MRRLSSRKICVLGLASPKGLIAGRFSTTIRLYAGLPRIDIHTRLFNDETFVRYRALFPAAIEGGNQRSALCTGAGAQRSLGSGRRNQGRQHLLRGCAAEYMQSVANAEFLDVAQLGIELGDRLALGLAFHQAAFLCEPRCPGALDDLLLEEPEAAAVEPFCRGIFLDQPLHLGQRAMQPGLAERRSGGTTYSHAGLKNHDRQSTVSQTVSATRQYDAFGLLVSSTGTWKRSTRI